MGTHENYEAWKKRREAIGEKVGGGFIVMRRSSKNGRIKMNNRQKADGTMYAVDPFEHPTFEAALAEAERLAAMHPHSTFAVFEQRVVVEGPQAAEEDTQPASDVT